MFKLCITEVAIVIETVAAYFRKACIIKLARLSLVLPLVRALPRMMTAGIVSDDPSVGQFRSIFSDKSDKMTEKHHEDKDKEAGGVMVQCVNHATGQNSWKMMPSDYDYNQELARAAFADMLHDSERNRLYYEGLRAAIRQG